MDYGNFSFMHPGGMMKNQDFGIWTGLIINLLARDKKIKKLFYKPIIGGVEKYLHFLFLILIKNMRIGNSGLDNYALTIFWVTLSPMVAEV